MPPTPDLPPTDSLVGVVVPAYKEADNIANLLRAIREQLPHSRIAVVDDSPDLATAEAAEGAGLPQVAVIHRSTKGGRGSAVIEGLQRLLDDGCSTIVEMDADFSHKPSEIPLLLGALTSRHLGMVIGSRYLPESRIENWPLSRRLFSRYANWLARNLLGVPIRDYTNGFRVYSQPAARIVAATCGRIGTGFIPLSEILVNLYCRGIAIGEVPTIFINRARGESSVNLTEIRNALVGIVRITLLKRRLMKQQPAESVA
jgi:dolichol-phosphate mannosyltransferase